MRRWLGVMVMASLGVFASRGTAATVRVVELTLEQAYDRALATDQAARIAFYAVKKANLLPWSALARLGPQLNANAGSQTASRSFTSDVTRATAGSATSAPRSFTESQTNRTRIGTANASLVLEQPLIDLTFFPAYRFGKLSAQSARLARQFTIRETLFGVASAYFEVLKQKRLVDVNRLALDLAGQQFDFSQKRANVGEVTRTDVLRAQVSVEVARRALIESENALEFNRNTLRNILNYEPSTQLLLAEPAPYSTELPAFETLLGQAYSEREDLREQTIAIDQDIARKNEVAASYGPRVVAQVVPDYSRSTGDSRSTQNSWTAGATVQVPIFNGGQREIDLATAHFQIEQTRLQRDQLAKSIESDVKQAWLTVRTLEGTLTALKTQVAAALQGYEDLQNQYRAGTATSVDVLSALNDLNTTRKDLAVQTYDYQVALRNLEQVSGVFQEARVQRAKLR